MYGQLYTYVMSRIESEVKVAVCISSQVLGSNYHQSQNNAASLYYRQRIVDIISLQMQDLPGYPHYLLPFLA